MADAAKISETALGEQLEALLDALANAGLYVGPRERILATRLAVELIGRGQAASLSDMRPSLGAVLARSPEEREIFERTFRAFQPQASYDFVEPDPVPKRPTKTGPKQAWSKWGFLALVIGLIAAGLIWRTLETAGPGIDKSDKDNLEIPELPLAQSNANVDKADDIEEASPILERVREASRVFASAPTIDELASALDRKEGWRLSGYAIRLHELTGLPRRQPLAIYGSNGAIWARLAHALDRIENPGAEKTLRRYTKEAAASLNAEQAEPLPQIYALSDRIGVWLTDRAPQPNETKTVLFGRIETQRQAALKQSGAGPLPPLDPFLVERALAISTDPKIRRVFADAHWFTRGKPSQAATAPDWAPFAAALIPLSLALIWLINSLALRKAYLRRRPPQRRPEHVQLVADAANQIGEFGSKFRRISQQLATRTSTRTGRIDVAGTIRAAIADGTGMIRPVYEEATRAPEYLVLIERRSAGDQEARRHRELVRQLEGLLHFNVFYFRTEPSILEPDGGGKPIAIERLRSSHAGQRLLVIGSGIGFLDPVDFEPLPAAQVLTHWDYRALLTPVPLAEWGREEFELARQLNMPVGRATVEGLTGLSELLGLEGNLSRDSVEPHGDALARPLPEVFRLRPQRLLYDTPPTDLPEEQVLQDLRNFLDPASFDWLCALAVYPAVQWDLTIYLGVALPETAGGDPARAPLYNEARIAALTQLPWLREGMMPNWLRRALMREMPPKRSKEVRRALAAVLEQAREQDGAFSDSAVKFDISREVAQSALAETFDDEVLLDFLARGDIEDLKVDQSNLIKRLVPKGILDRIGWPELIAAGVAGIYAAAAYLLTPRAGAPLVTGAWLPLVFLGVGAVIALGLANPYEAYRRIRLWLMRSTTFGLAFALAVLLSAPLQIVRLTLSDAFASQFNAALAAAVLGLLAARSIVKWLWLPTWMSAGSIWKRGAIFWAKCLALAVVVFGIWQLLEPPPQRAGINSASDYFAALAATLSPLSPVYSQLLIVVAAGFSLFALGFAAARFLPEHLPEAPSMVLSRGPDWAAGALKVAICLLPILPAIYLSVELASSSVILNGVSREITARAQLPDGSVLALGGSDGQVTFIQFEERGGFEQSSVRFAGGSIVDLALHELGPGRTKVAFALRDGMVRGGVLSSRPDGLEFQSSFSKQVGGASNGAPLKIAYNGQGHLVSATESDVGASQISVEGRGSDITVTDGPVTAMASAGPGFVYATMDGRLWHVSNPAYQAQPTPTEPQSDSTIVDFRNFGRARTLKIIPDTKQSDRYRLVAIGDDGTVITGYVGDGFEELTLMTDHREKLALTTKPAIWRGIENKTPGADAEETSSKKFAALVYDVDNQQLLYSQNIDELRYPASLVKVMTLFIVFDRLADDRLRLDDQISVSPKAAAVPPAKAGLRAGETLSVEQAISLIATKSANDVAVAVAEHIAGSEEAFADLMTREAQALGMAKSVFKNASGLPDREQVTTTRDLLTLSLAMLKRFPQYYKYFGLETYEFRGKTYKNFNALLTSFEGTDGIKTGYTRASGFNIIVSANRVGGATNGRGRLIAIVTGGRTSAVRNSIVRALLGRYYGDPPTADSEILIAEDGSQRPKALKEIAAAAADIGKRAASVDALVEELDTEVAALVKEDSSSTKAARLSPELQFAQAKGKLPRPTYARRVLPYGAETQSGGVSKGEFYQTRDNAQVTSPADGWVVYAGEFRAYGQILIINCGDGYQVLLAGFEKITAQPGQFVLSAEPVGEMGGRDSETEPFLYVEFRKDGKPIDPAPWWENGTDTAASDTSPPGSPRGPDGADGSAIEADPNPGLAPSLGIPRKPIIVIDPGHGGADLGAQKFGLLEKDVVLRLALELGRKLVEENGYVVKLTRLGDQRLTLQRRREFAERSGADVFLSLHVDSARSDATGPIIYTLQPSILTELFGSDNSELRQELQIRNRALGQSIASELVEPLLTKENPLRPGKFGVLRTTKLAAALIEVGYVSNRADAQAMLSQDWRDRVVGAIATSLERYFKRYPAERRQGEPIDSEQQPPLLDPSSVPLPAALIDDPNTKN